MNKFFALLLASAALALVAHPPAWAQDRAPLKVLVGFPAGGPPDLVARKVAALLAEQTGRAVVIENRPGASGTIAAAAVARAAPDGNTLLFGVAANLAVAPATMRQPPYDAVQDFTPIVEVARGAYVLLVRSDAPATTLADFTDWARSRPGKLNYASPGNGSVHHLAMELLQLSRGLRLVHVPYRSTIYAPLLAGDVQVILESLPGPLPLLESGKIRALAVTGPRRLARLPDVPTLRELGVPELDHITSWWGLVGPRGMPAATVQRLNTELRRAMADPELVATMNGWGIALTPGSADEFGRYLAAENRRWKDLVQQLALPLE